MKPNAKTQTGIILWTVCACAIHILLFRSKLDISLPIPQRLAFAVLAVVATLPLHETLHWVCMKLLGMPHARIEFAKDPLGLPSLRAIAQGFVTGWKRIVLYLTPFLLLTVVPDILFLLNAQVHFLFFIMAMCNAAGCYFDLVAVLQKPQK